MFRLVYSSFFIIFTGGIIAMASLAPVIQEMIGYPSGENIYSLLSNICHQYPLNSFWIFERPFAICARCFSAYSAILIMTLFFLKNKIKTGFIKGFIILKATSSYDWFLISLILILGNLQGRKRPPSFDSP